MMKKLIVAVIIAASLMMFSSTTWAQFIPPADNPLTSYNESLMGASVLYAVTPLDTNGDAIFDLWQYDLNVSNTSTSQDFYLWELKLDFWDLDGEVCCARTGAVTPEGVGVTNNAAANGWFFEVTNHTDGSVGVLWQSDYGSEIAPGGSVGDFTFNVDYEIPIAALTTRGEKFVRVGYSSEDGVPNVSMRGIPVAASEVPVVPEPVSAVLFLAGVATLGVRGYLKKK